MHAVVIGVGARRILAIVGVVRLRAASIIGTRRNARGYVLIYRDDEVQSAYVLVSNADRFIEAQLSLNFEIHLLGIRVLHLPVHRREVEQHVGRKRESTQDVGKYRSSGLSRRKVDADLTQLRYIGGVARR